MKYQKYRKIGIIGGMGPASTAELYTTIISIFQKRLGAQYDSDFPEIVLISLPIPDIVETVKNEELVIKMLIDAAKRLERIGASFIAIPCNTMHAYIKILRRNRKIPVLSIMEEVAIYANFKSIKNVGVFSTEYTRNKRLFEKELGKNNINILQLNQINQTILTKIIMRIMSGELLQSDRIKLISMVNTFERQNANAVILGCTDIPLLLKQQDCKIKLIDTIQILAEACVRESIKNYINQNPEDD